MGCPPLEAGGLGPRSQGNSALMRMLPPALWSLDGDDGQGTGFVIDSLASARVAFGAGPYESVVKTAVGFGNDTDTTACIAGGVAGLRDGVAAITERWRAALRGMDLVQPLLDGLLRHHQL